MIKKFIFTIGFSSHTSANSIPWGSRYRHIPCRWLSRKSSSRRNLTAHNERQSRQYTEISSSRDCAQTHKHTHDTRHRPDQPANSTPECVCVCVCACVFYPIQLQCKLLVPGLIADRLPAGLTHYSVVQFQHCADLIWGNRHTVCIVTVQLHRSS